MRDADRVVVVAGGRIAEEGDAGRAPGRRRPLRAPRRSGRRSEMDEPAGMLTGGGPDDAARRDRAPKSAPPDCWARTRASPAARCSRAWRPPAPAGKAASRQTSRARRRACSRCRSRWPRKRAFAAGDLDPRATVPSSELLGAGRARAAARAAPRPAPHRRRRARPLPGTQRPRLRHVAARRRRHRRGARRRRRRRLRRRRPSTPRPATPRRPARRPHDGARRAAPARRAAATPLATRSRRTPCGNTVHNSRIPLGATDRDVRVAHKTGSLSGWPTTSPSSTAAAGRCTLAFLTEDGSTTRS